MTLCHPIICLVVAHAVWSPARLYAQITTAPQPPSEISSQREISSLDLAPELREQLSNAIQQRDFKKAESILVDQTSHDPRSLRTARLLEFAGGIFFLDGNYLNSAIAWEKAQAIAPLDARSRFTLAMAYIELRCPQWAERELQKLASEQPRNPLYVYWLARLDYDQQRYTEAIEKLTKVTELDSQMTRVYDLLGLCYDYLGRLQDAMSNFTRSVQLNRIQMKPSAWPNLDMAICQIELDDLAGAEKNLREAIAYDPHLPQAQYNLGRILDKQGKYQEAIEVLNAAVSLEQQYPEPHYLLGRIYQRLGEPERAKAETERFQQLRIAQSPLN